ncbi:MAG TPA: neutral/alkaline non-lysosomal ceramidase N-terminal domain-containing protein [Chloroflexota bacterium]|nr:neutral/alkaline non-lysosomal ceramidase N-terminal domain-containing protein [Chloroflexota bacterium]
MAGLRAGVARREITPPVGVELCGYGPFLGRSSTAVHDPLECRVLALEADGKPLVLVSCDLVGVLQEATDAIREQVQASHGVEPDRLMITCTHTHAGPNTVRLIGWGEPDEEYRATLRGYIVETVRRAVDDLKPARLAIGQTVLEGIGRNRVHTDGTGLVDPEVTVLRVSDEAGRLKAVVFHHTAHPVVMGSKNRIISGDWAGNAERRLESDSDGPFIAAFLNGTCGDINSAIWAQEPPAGWDAIDQLGAKMHAAVRELLPRLVDEPSVVIAAHRTRLDLPLGRPDEEAIAQIQAGYDHTPREGTRPYYVTKVASDHFEQVWAETMQGWLKRPDADRLPVELQAVRIGPLALIGIPAEVFSIFGFAIKQASPFRRTAVVGYANDLVGYIARPQDYTDPGFGGYAAVMAPKILGLPPFAPHAGQVLVDACLRALERVAES